MEDRRKVMSEIESQIFYITQENIQLEQEHKAGLEANFKLITNREKLKRLMRQFMGSENEVF